jgi:RNA polymerase sigma-70 factor (ECF subfamily)
MKPGSPEADEIAAFLLGEQDAVGEVRAAIRVVVRSFQFRGRDVEQELIQDVIGRLVQNLSAGRFRGEASLRTYAQQVAKYACLGHIRRQRAEVRVDFETVPSEARWSGPEEALLMEEEHLGNLAALSALPEESRALLRMIFVDGLTYLDVARRLGVTESTIKSRVHRVRMQCRERSTRLPSPARKPPERANR